MGRYLSWLANAVLFGLCCFLLANTANTVFAALLTPAPAELAPAEAPAPPTGRTWQDRQAILSRNLFNASLLAPTAAPLPVEEELEETKLPLTLLGTYASNDLRQSWAAVEDKDTRTHLVLRIDDDVKNGKARVTRIERGRIVLSENGTLRELTLEEEVALKMPGLARRTPPKARRSAASRKRTAARRTAKPTANPDPDLANAMRNPAALLAGGRPMPKFEDGSMVGFSVSDIEDGSIYQQAGLEDGDVITQVNGVELNDPQQSAQFVMEFAGAEQVEITILKPDGTTFTKAVPLP